MLRSTAFFLKDIIMEKGKRFQMFGELYEVVCVKGASLIARKVSSCGLYWIIEDDLP